MERFRWFGSVVLVGAFALPQFALADRRSDDDSDSRSDDDSDSDSDSNSGKKKKKNRIEICHYEADSGSWTLMRLKANAAGAHLALHDKDVRAGAYYPDADGDFLGDPDAEPQPCPQAESDVTNNADCNDAAPPICGCDPCDPCDPGPICGNGQVEGEQCDDGNDVDGDGCSSQCTTEAFCGDGNVDPGEECDGAAPLECTDLGFAGGQTRCTAACTLDVSDCVDFEPEVCGDGLDNDGDGAIDCDDADCAGDPACDDPALCQAALECGFSECVFRPFPENFECFVRDCAAAVGAAPGDIPNLEAVAECGLANGCFEQGNDDEIISCLFGVCDGEIQRCVDGGCGGLTDCNGQCVDLGSDAQNCGQCGVACDAGFQCLGGACRQVDQEVCDDGLDNDGDGAVDCADGDCAGDPTCAGGQCVDVLECYLTQCEGLPPPESFFCLDACVQQTPLNAQARQAAEELAFCAEATGCIEDPDLLGCLSRDCTGEFQTCVDGGGAQEDCNDGVDNDGDGLIDCADDDCAGNAGCGGGGGCDPGLEDCGGVCVNLSTDANNCGGCGNVCGPGAQCQAGRCVAACEDADGDTFFDAACGGEDCDDGDPETNPNADEICGDGRDNDCDGNVDETCACQVDADCVGAERCVNGACVAACEDADNDGFPDAACGGDDCDDADGDTNPAADEVCGDGRDNDCDGAVDETCGGCQGDAECDPFERCIEGECRACEQDADGHIAAECGGDDCDDLDPEVFPGNRESCDGRDNDCDGLIDEDPDCVGE